MNLATPCMCSQSTTVIVDGDTARGARGSD
jgi:hypothetical protein